MDTRNAGDGGGEGELRDQEDREEEEEERREVHDEAWKVDSVGKEGKEEGEEPERVLEVEGRMCWFGRGDRRDGCREEGLGMAGRKSVCGMGRSDGKDRGCARVEVLELMA